jgi:hypothetical protein
MIEILIEADMNSLLATAVLVQHCFSRQLMHFLLVTV